MRVALNGQTLSSSSLRGWNRYTINLACELASLGVDLVVYGRVPVSEVHHARLRETGCRVEIAPRMPYFLWEQRWLPRQCRRDGIELLHCPFNFGLPWSNRCPQVLTLHDAIDDRFYRPQLSRAARWRPAVARSRLHHWIARSRADHIITVSEHARRDLIQAWSLSAERITVTYEAADPRFLVPATSADRARVDGRYKIRPPYVFYVGGFETRKNVRLLVQAFATASLDGAELVLAGEGAADGDALRAQAADLGAGDRVRLLGPVDDADLPALYAGALCFVYPSRYEGFGLQLCEAMSMGCPTLAARTTSLPEVLGDGGETFAADNPDELARLMRRVAGDPAFRRDLVARAARRARAFGWQHTAERTLAVYRRAIAGPAQCLEAS